MQVGHYDIVACAECEKDATAMAFEKVKCERPQVSLFIFIVLLCMLVTIISFFVDIIDLFVRYFGWDIWGGRESIEND